MLGHVGCSGGRGYDKLTSALGEAVADGTAVETEYE